MTVNIEYLILSIPISNDLQLFLTFKLLSQEEHKIQSKKELSFKYLTNMDGFRIWDLRRKNLLKDLTNYSKNFCGHLITLEIFFSKLEKSLLDCNIILVRKIIV